MFLQSAVASGTSNPPTWRISDWNVPTLATRSPQRLKRRKRTPVAEGETMGEKSPRILPKVATSTSLLGSFTCRKVTTWDRRLYFPSERGVAEDIFRPKNPTVSAGFEPANLGTKDISTLTSRPRKTLVASIRLAKINVSFVMSHVPRIN